MEADPATVDGIVDGVPHANPSAISHPSCSSRCAAGRSIIKTQQPAAARNFAVALSNASMCGGAARHARTQTCWAL